nr:ERAD-associated E3 ubiquitin-protein ligase HRD1A-like [Drosophila bipectinata]
MNPAEAEKGAATPMKMPICMICNKEMATGRARTKCGHEFHKTCITTHARSKSSCPTCKVVCFEKVQAASDTTAASTSQQTRRPDSPCGTSQAGSQSESLGSTAELQALVSQSVSAMQATLLEQLSTQVDRLFHQRERPERDEEVRA